MNDFNCEIQRNIKGLTGRWFMNKRPDDGHNNVVIILFLVNHPLGDTPGVKYYLTDYTRHYR